MDLQKKPVQAFVPILYGVAYVAAALVAAGAVGVITKDLNGTYGGVLYDQAKTTYDNMADPMKQNLETVLASGAVVTVGSVAGLYTYLHDSFMALGSIVPLVPNVISTESFFKTGTGISIGVAWWEQGGTNRHITNLFINLQSGVLPAVRFDNIICDFYQPASTFTNVDVSHATPPVPADTASYITALITASLYGSSTLGASYTGTYPASFPPGAIGSSVADGNSTRPINPPANLQDLSNATPTTPYTDRNGVPTTVIPDDATKLLSNAAAVAAAAAMAAALAAGLSVAAAQAAAAAAMASAAAGADVATAAAAGAAAATATTTADTATLTKDIANTKTGDVIDMAPLKFAALLFTKKFPFSLPWDLKDMLSSFGSNAVSTPVFNMPLFFTRGGVTNNIPVVVSLERFDGLAAAARVFELFIFNIGMLFGTRKLLGGAS